MRWAPETPPTPLPDFVSELMSSKTEAGIGVDGGKLDIRRLDTIYT